MAPASAQKGKRPAGDGQAVRESLTLLPGESSIIDAARLKLAALGVIPNRSEIIRGGILALGSMSDDQLAKVIAKVPRLKHGRPA